MYILHIYIIYYQLLVCLRHAAKCHSEQMTNSICWLCPWQTIFSCAFKHPSFLPPFLPACFPLILAFRLALKYLTTVNVYLRTRNIVGKRKSNQTLKEANDLLLDSQSAGLLQTHYFLALIRVVVMLLRLLRHFSIMLPIERQYHATKWSFHVLLVSLLGFYMVIARKKLCQIELMTFVWAGIRFIISGRQVDFIGYKWCARSDILVCMRSE